MKYISASIAALLSSVAATEGVWRQNGGSSENKDARYDMSLIGVSQVTAPAAGAHLCAPGDWTTVHWVGTLPDLRVVTDSRAEPGGNPKSFALGASEVFRCWDLAIQKLHVGETADLACPSYLAWGAAFTHAPLGGEPIPLNTNVNFKIEVVGCGRQESFIKYKDQPVTTTLQPDRCFYLHLDDSEQTVNDLVLSTDAEDFGPHWPGRYLFLEHQVYDDLAQQWFYNEMSGSIHNNREKNYFLQNDHGELMVADDQSYGAEVSEKFPKGWENRRKWFWNPTRQTLETQIGNYNNVIGTFGSPKPQNQYVKVGVENTMIQNSHHRWRIEYCNQVELGTKEPPQGVSSDPNAKNQKGWFANLGAKNVREYNGEAFEVEQDSGTSYPWSQHSSISTMRQSNVIKPGQTYDAYY